MNNEKESWQGSEYSVVSNEFSYRKLKTLHLCCVASVPLYAVSAHFLHNMTLPAWLLYLPFVALVYDIVRAPRRFRELRQSQQTLSKDPSDQRAFARYRLREMHFYMTGETLGVAGWVLQVSGKNVAIYYAFYLAGFLLLLMFTPRRISD